MHWYDVKVRPADWRTQILSSDEDCGTITLEAESAANAETRAKLVYGALFFPARFTEPALFKAARRF